MNTFFNHIFKLRDTLRYKTNQNSPKNHLNENDVKDDRTNEISIELFKFIDNDLKDFLTHCLIHIMYNFNQCDN